MCDRGKGKGDGRAMPGRPPPGRPPPAALAKRFYEEAGASARDGGYAVLLDGRPIRTPGRQVVHCPARALATAIADEWRAQGEHIDPATMPLTGLSYMAIDGVSRRMSEVRADIVKFAGSDLLCYRAAHPRALAAEQTRHWDPILAWAADHLDVHLRCVQGIMPARQSDDALAGFAVALADLDAFRLTPLHRMTTLLGSALLALAHAKGRLDAAAAFGAAHVDEDWQIAKWGDDREARERRQMRWREMQSASHFLDLLR